MKNKNAMAVGILVGMIIVFVSFFMYLIFFANITKGVVSNADDISCRAYVSLKDFPGIKFGELFYKIKEKCKVDTEIKVDLSEKNEAFKEIGDEMARCWYRYGEGQYDFLSNFDTTGNWCFICGSVKMEDTNSVLTYKEFVEWTTKEKINESMTYYKYINIKYVSTDDKEAAELRSEFEDLLADDPGAELKPMLMAFSDQLNYLDDLRYKQLDSNDENLYVVYRYDRLAKSREEKMKDAESAALWGTGGAVIVGIISEMMIEGAVMGGYGAATGGVVGGVVGVGAGAAPGAAIGGFIGGSIGIVKGAIKGTIKTAASFKKVFRIGKLMKRATNLIKFSGKNLDELHHLEEIGVVTISGSERIVRTFSNIKNFRASSKEIEGFGEMIKDVDPKMAKSFKNLAGFMDELKIDDLSKIDPNILKLGDDVQKNYKNLGKIIDDIDDVNLAELAKGEEKIFGNIDDLKALKALAKEEIEAMEKGLKVVDDIPGIRDYLRVSIILGTGLGSGAIAYNYNDNYVQYVDLLTREQYYRLCGTEGGNFDK